MSLDPSLLDRIQRGIVDYGEGQLHGVVTHKDALELLEAYNAAEKQIEDLRATLFAGTEPEKRKPVTTGRRKPKAEPKPNGR